jgi:hypothetical protein
MTSNECEAEPSTIESMRIHAISYMNELSPVPKAIASITVSSVELELADVPAGVAISVSGLGADADSGASGSRPRSRRHTAMIAKLSTPAAAKVPGKPNHGTSTKPEINAPSDAPKLLEKYRKLRISPERSRSRRRIPTLINGNVMPSRMHGGAINIPAAVHLASATPPPPTAGNTTS